MDAGRRVLLWVALCVALSASLVDLAEHLATSPWARGTALVALLFAVGAWTDPAPPRPARDGFLWVALGLAVSLVCVAGGMTRAGRPGIAIAAIGLSRVLGRPSMPRAMLAAWVVPVPSALQNALAPGLAGLVAAAAAHAAPFAGVAAHVDASHVDRLVLATQSGALDLFPGDGGLPLAWTLSGVGWFAAVQRGGSWRAALARALRFALAAIPLQLAALAAACTLALLGATGAARALLDHAVVIAGVAALAVAMRGAAEPAPS